MSISILIHRLENDELHYSDAFKILKKLPKPWHTKSWKQKREELLQTKCSTCNSDVKPLVLQHFIQPRQFSSIYDEVLIDKLKEIYPEYPNNIIIDFEKTLLRELEKEAIIRNACPICETVNIRERKTMSPRYICISSHAFEIPINLKYYQKSRTTNLNEAIKDRSFYLFENRKIELIKSIRKSYDREIGKMALIMSLKESLEYYEFKYVKTLCRKCAFIEDQIYISRKGIAQYLAVRTVTQMK